MTSADLTGRKAFITGATAGIGLATARAFAAAGVDHLVLAARRRDRLEQLAKDLGSEHGTDCTVLEMDVSSREAIERLHGAHQEAFDVDILVNNAGLARGVDPVQSGEMKDWEEMVDTNVLGLLHLTRLVVPHMVERGDGHVVNLGSTAGRWVYPGGAVYCATKHAVRAISEGLRMDLHGSGVRVTNIAPGLVETEFSEVRFKGDTEKAASVYENMRALTGNDIAETILWSVGRPAHVNIQEMIVMPTDQSSVTMVHRQP